MNTSESSAGSRRDFVRNVGTAGAGLALAHFGTSCATPQTGGATVAGPVKLDRVRVGFIGVGARGSGHVGHLLTLDGVDIAAICDKQPAALEAAVARVEQAGRPKPAAYGNGDYDYRRMLERGDLDIVIIATPWEWHVKMCVDTMQAGKHAFVEVPAAITVEGCWELVETAEQTQRHCMMMENCCYGREELFCLNIVRLGLLGELLHGEAAYIHNGRGLVQKNAERGTISWRTLHYARRNGNLYPTHGLGPIAQYMGINRGDRFDYMSTVASPVIGRPWYAKEHLPPTHEWNQIKAWKCSDINTTIIKTALGRSIMVQFDTITPRPYTRLNLIQGTQGVFAGYPSRLACEGVTKGTEEWTEKEPLEEIMKKYEHPLWKRIGSEARQGGGHGGMDWLMLWRIVYCLRNDEPLDQDVYDAAAWSVIGPLSEKSIARRSASVDVPDFTRGGWKNRPPIAIVS